MAIGVVFFIATFIFMGQIVATCSPKTGILVTILGIFRVSLLCFISGLHGLAKGLVDSGVV
jgi:hypothetical protein